MLLTGRLSSLGMSRVIVLVIMTAMLSYSCSLGLLQTASSGSVRSSCICDPNAADAANFSLLALAYPSRSQSSVFTPKDRCFRFLRELYGSVVLAYMAPALENGTYVFQSGVFYENSERLADFLCHVGTTKKRE